MTLLKQRSEIAKLNSDIEIPNEPVVKARKFFVRFGSETANHIGKVHGFWGFVWDVRAGNNVVWLNSGYKGISARISNSCLNALVATFGPWQSWKAKDALFIGKLERGSNGKLFVRIEEEGMLAIDR